VILDAQEHAAAARTSGSPDVNRVEHVAEVQVPGRRRREARTRDRQGASDGCFKCQPDFS
jgi:hypothetical protein